MMSTTEDLNIEASHDREEGELEDSDVEEGTYIPLQRPEAFNPPSLVNMQIQDEPSDEESTLESTGSESEGEARPRAKRTKFRPRRQNPISQTDKKNKYNIWCTTLQEDTLTEDMVGCGVTKKSRYGVESYDYTIKYRLEDNCPKKVFTNNKQSRDDQSNKRRHMDRTNVKLRLGKRINSHQQNEEKQQPRILQDLLVTSENEVEDVAKDIAEKLSEEKQDLIERIVRVLGASKAIEIYKETQRVEADGGMLVMNGHRRRTPGGVYFFLLKRDDEVSQEKVTQVFNEDRKETVRRIKKTRAKTRQKVMEQLKQSLTDCELPSLASRGEAAAAPHGHGSNPPPSPATDARDCSSDTDPSPCARAARDYDDDDFLEVMCNDEMDLF